MKGLLVFFCVFVVGINAQHCHKAHQSDCGLSLSPKNDKDITCNARYGSIGYVEAGLKKFAQLQLDNSYTFLLMGAHFGGYKYNRAGLHKLYNKLSDETWDATIDLIKHITKRGSSMNEVILNITNDIQYNELESLAVTVDTYKYLADKANNLIQHKKKENKMIEEAHSDPEITSYLEENFLEKYSEKIRHLVGYNRDLRRMLNNEGTKALGLEIFDMHIAK